jgi:hypothetical protein
MVDAVARVRFQWNMNDTVCRATAFDAPGALLGEVTIQLPDSTTAQLLRARGAGARLRLEEIAERHLRTMLELRY